MNWIWILVVGLAAGVASGLLGIGGGTIVVPALVYFFGFTQHKAQGTILAAFLPPVAFLAFWRYYKSGNVDMAAALVLALGILIGGWFGAGLSLSMPEVTIKRVFGVFLFLLAVKMILNR